MATAGASVVNVVSTYAAQVLIEHDRHISVVCAPVGYFLEGGLLVSFLWSTLRIMHKCYLFYYVLPRSHRELAS